MRNRSVAALTSLVLATSGFVAVLAPHAGAADAGFYSLVAGPVKIQNSAYTVSVQLNNVFEGRQAPRSYSGKANILITLARTATGGNHAQASVFYSFRGGDFNCATDLSTCIFDSGGAMGKYGGIDMQFSPSGSPTHTDTRCPATGKIYSKNDTQKGSFNGTFTLHSHKQLFGDITNIGAGRVADSWPAGASRSEFTGQCNTCQQYTGLFASKGGTYLNATKPLPSGKGRATLSINTSEPSTATAPAAISYTIQVLAPPSTVTVSKTLESGHVAGNAGAPFIGGSLDFTQSGDTSKSGQGCVNSFRPQTADGDLVAHFPVVGDRHIKHDNQASATRVVKA
jgi:hypothetical protein